MTGPAFLQTAPRASDSECGLRASEYCACRNDEGRLASASSIRKASVENGAVACIVFDWNPYPVTQCPREVFECQRSGNPSLRNTLKKY